MKLYLIGSLRNPNIPVLGASIREATGIEVFDDWYAAGPEADDYWKKYETERGRSYGSALEGYAANHVYEFDKKHLDSSDIVVLALPAGRSGHLELGYAIGSGARGYILLEPDADPRWDVMYRFAHAVFDNEEELIDELKHQAEQSGSLRRNGATLPLREVD